MRYRYLFQLNEYLLIAVWLVVVIGEERCGLHGGEVEEGRQQCERGCAGAMTLIFLGWRSCQGRGGSAGCAIDSRLHEHMGM